MGRIIDMRFNITEKEYHDFMECVDLWSYDAAKEFLTGVLPLSRLSFKIRTAENRDYVRHSYIKFYAGKIVLLDLDAKKDRVDLVNKILKEATRGLSCIYTSNKRDLYVDLNDETSNIIVLRDPFSVDFGVLPTVTVDLQEENADCSDKFWNMIIDIPCASNAFMHVFVNTPEKYSVPIQKRLQKIYDNLSDSEKLLIEVGEDLNI